MTLDWLPRDDEKKLHQLWGEEHFGKDAPSVIYEKRPLTSPNNGRHEVIPLMS